MKTVLITGASAGIGKAAVQYFAQQGWNVAATMRSPEKELELAVMPQVRCYRLDVTDKATIEQAFSAIIQDFKRIDVVINNAGYGVDGIFEAMTDETIAKQFDTNVLGLMRVTRAAIYHMRATGGGTIVQIASMGGRLAFPLFSIYHGTKWAVEGFSESLHYELKPLGIKVRIVEPGAIKTEFYGRSREAVRPTDTNVYDAFIEKCEKVNLGPVNTGEAPEVVAKTIFKAATDTGNRLRYVVGAPAPMLLRLRKMLPDSWWFGVVNSSYKI